jgi:hypothetical protein
MRIAACTLLSLLVLSACTPPHPRDVVTYKLDWWPYQEGLYVKELRIEALEGRSLNLVNNKAQVKVTISGEVSYLHGHWRPQVKHVHANEKFTPSPVAEDRVSNIEFTPVVDVAEDDAYSGAPIPFTVSFEYTISTFRWGSNTVRFVAGGKEQKVILRQIK